MTSKSKQPATTEKPPPSTQPLVNQDQLPALPGSEIAIAAAFPGEKSNSDDAAVELLAAAITEHWTKSRASILVICKLCAEDASRLDARQRRELINKLPFKEAMFSK